VVVSDMVYTKVRTDEEFPEPSTVIAFNVVVELIVIGDEYKLLDVVGVVPFNV